MNPVDGWVSQEFANLAQVLADYDPNLALEMIPPEHWDKLTDKKKIFRVVDIQRNQIVCYFDSLAAPQDILAHIWDIDQKNGNPIRTMENRNLAAQALQMRKHQDELDAQRDFAYFVVKNQKSRWKAPDGTYRDEHYNNLGTGKTVID